MLRFTHATMGSGKSLVALATAHSLEDAGQPVLLLTRMDRSGRQIASRSGLSAPAVALSADDDLAQVWRDQRRPRHIVVDEAQFLSVAQVDVLADLADLTPPVEVHCFGLLTDFRQRLFDGARRLVEVADEIVALPIRARCWCGRPASVNARVVNGRVATDGPTVLVGDTVVGADTFYRTLCRLHFREASWEAENQVALDV